MITFCGALPSVRRSYASRAASKATRTLSRRSSSSMTRWTYGFWRAAATAPAAAAAFFFFVAMQSLLWVGVVPLGASIPARPCSSRGPRKSGVEHVADVGDPHEPQPLAQVLGHVLGVRLVERRRDHGLDAAALRGER